MDCRDCPRYDAEKSLCRDGKVNPQKWSLAVEVATYMGTRALCPLNDFRERLVGVRATPSQRP